MTFEELLEKTTGADIAHSEGDARHHRLWYEQEEGNDIIVSFDHGNPVAIQVAGEYEMYYPAN